MLGSRIAILLLVFLTYGESQARSYSRKSAERSIYDIGISQKTFSDIQFSGSGTASTAAPLTEVLIGMRLFRVYSFIISGVTASNKETLYSYSAIQGLGFGFRAGLPGIFFMGGDRRELNRRSKLYPINTYGYVMTSGMSYTFKGGPVRDASTEWGITMDVFLFSNDLHLTLSGGIANLGENSFLVNKVGLAWEW